MEKQTSWIQRIGVLVVLVLVCLYVGVSVMGMAETKDAQLVDASQRALQDAVERGGSLLGLAPKDIHPANLVNATRTSLPKGVRLDTGLHLEIRASGRQAWFKLDPQGQMALVGLQHFSRYHIVNGHITRNNHWSLPFTGTLPKFGE